MSARPNSLAGSNPSSNKTSRNLSSLKRVTLAGTPSSDNVLASLRATTIVASKPVLPAELIDTVLQYVEIPDLMRFARVSRRMKEMVYDDTRWIQKLKAIGVWNEKEARQRFDESMKKTEAYQIKGIESARKARPENSNGIPGVRSHAGSVTLFDAGWEEDKYRQSQTTSHQTRNTATDGFDDAKLSSMKATAVTTKAPDPNAALSVLKRVRSIRGHARQEFGAIYEALGPIYSDLGHVRGNSDAIMFRTYRDPEQQAQILSNLRSFSQCDAAIGARVRRQKLDSMIEVFKNAVLREFEGGYAAEDYDGRTRRYAHVLATIDDKNSSVTIFMEKNPITRQTDNPRECLEDVAPGHVDLSPSLKFFTRLATEMVEQASIIDKVFPPSIDVLETLLSRICDTLISSYLDALFNEARTREKETYVKAVSGTFEQSMRFVSSLKPVKASPSNFKERARQMVTRCFEKHFELYLAEEISVFKTKSKAEIDIWNKEMSEQEASTESFFMSNINRQAVKRDFLSSFKKVVMMPVNVLPTFSGSKVPASATAGPVASLTAEETAGSSSRPRTPTLTGNTPVRSSTPQQEAPTNELAAKAAIMNSRLEGIKSLFSIEVALNLTHLAKTSLERVANMVRMGGKYSEDAKETGRSIFVTLLHTLGDDHIRVGFDKAVGHLGSYNPRQDRELQGNSATDDRIQNEHRDGVAPLMTFLELVNVGDLIQQMIDVFYAQELVAANLTDRDDFLDPAVKEKKRFEQMLDERVAAGLNKGIDVLIDEVEYICASTQVATDFNPGIDTNSKGGFGQTGSVVDIGPSRTAKQVVDIISGHTSMLVGSTDKNMLDVFMQEVGLRLFGVLCKHVKRQRISVDGAIKLISDLNHYSSFITSLRQKPLNSYFQALRELGQIYLVHIDPPAAYFSPVKGAKRGSILSTKNSPTAMQAKELATIIADTQRYVGIFPTEEVYEFAERRADWYLVKGDVERAMYGVGCSIM
ncbi:F-box protein [Acrodontium crateriforme]|uniref:F-box protein n=1 Tax=Acrodontium crateriforme TaxID=150365 RepID=A0AAQ3RDN9_9PEZI|nr:F-box protein [Acrodontium crateriforme]